MPDPIDLDDELPATGADSALESLLQKAAHVSVQEFEPRIPSVGQVIGEKYRLDARLGRGGMGVVFRATHLVSNKPVALKWVLRSASDSHTRARFLREARIAGRVDHPNVVDVYDVEEDGSHGYMVMELLHGESLRARLERGPLPVGEAVALLLQALRGISAIHQAGVVHRDIKPDNIFLCAGPDGTPREAKVLDFGISAIVATDPSDPTLTRDGVMLGTPGYMSPEQLQNAREVDVRTDVYACGVVLYEALAGTLPFVADNLPALVLAIAIGDPAPLTRRRADVPRELERIVQRALARRPEERFASIDELVNALASYAGAEGQVARLRRSSAGPLPPRRRILRSVLVTATALATALGTWVLSTRAPNDRPPAVQAAPAATPRFPEAPAIREPLAPGVSAGTSADAAAPHEAAATDRAAATPPLAPRPASRRARPPRGAVAAPPAAPPPPGIPPQPGAGQRSRSGRISVDEL